MRAIPGPLFALTQRAARTRAPRAAQWLIRAAFAGAIGLVVVAAASGQTSTARLQSAQAPAPLSDPAPQRVAGIFSPFAPEAEPALAQAPQPATRGDDEDLLFSQRVATDDLGVGPAQLIAIAASCPFGATAADDFILGRSAYISRLTFEGVYFGAAPDLPGPDVNLRVTIYNDNGAGNAGAIIADVPAANYVKTPHPREPVFGVLPVYTYHVQLDPPVFVPAGERRWLSVNINPAGPTGPAFGWMASHEGNAAETPAPDQPLLNQAITCNTLPATMFIPGGQVGTDADLAFALFGGCAGDCNCNQQDDALDISTGFSRDCNGNSVPDECDIHNEDSADCDGDGVPDECQLTSRFAVTSGPLTPFGADIPRTLLIPNAPLAASDLVIFVQARSDLNQSLEFVRLELNGVSIATLFTTDGLDCPNEPNSAALTMDALTYNSMILAGDGVARFRAVASSSVSPSLCSDGFISISVAYDLFQTRDCNGNGLIDSCEIASGLAQDCNGDDVPDDCQLTETYMNHSPELGPIGFPTNRAHALPDPPEAADEVLFTVAAIADLSGANEYIDVFLNGAPIGRAFESGAGDCPSQPNIAEIRLDAASFNALLTGGDATITLQPSRDVASNLCGDASHLTVTTQYLALAEMSADCDGDGVMDACEIAGGARDENSNGVPDTCETPGDMNGDGAVNSSDLAFLLARWGTDDDNADLNGDGTVNSTDLAFLLTLF